MSIDIHPHYQTPVTETTPSVAHETIPPKTRPAVTERLGLDAMQLIDLADGYELAARFEERRNREGAALGHSLQAKRLGRQARELDLIYRSYTQDTVEHPDLDPITQDDSWDD